MPILFSIILACFVYSYNVNVYYQKIPIILIIIIVSTWIINVAIGFPYYTSIIYIIYFIASFNNLLRTMMSVQDYCQITKTYDLKFFIFIMIHFISTYLKMSIGVFSLLAQLRNRKKLPETKTI